MCQCMELSRLGVVNEFLYMICILGAAFVLYIAVVFICTLRKKRTSNDTSQKNTPVQTPTPKKMESNHVEGAEELSDTETLHG